MLPHRETLHFPGLIFQLCFCHKAQPTAQPCLRPFLSPPFIPIALVTSRASVAARAQPH